MIAERLRREVRDLTRLRKIILTVMKHGFGMVIDRSKLRSYVPIHQRLTVKEGADTKKPMPERVRLLFEDLGPSFIKLGQLLSLRPDLIPSDYCDEFAKLQDEVAPIPFSSIKKAIEEEIGKPIQEVFKSVEPEPVASASIAQVHKGVLKNGEVVALKVQKPGIAQTISNDIDILLFAARMVERHSRPKIFDPVDIVEEFKRYTEGEVDFEREARYLRIFNRNFTGHKFVRIPKVHDKLVTKRLLVMQYMEGRKVSDIIRHASKISPLKRKQLAHNIVQAIFEQVFIHGFFHADPHPGNIIVQRDHITFLDFGIVGFLDSELQEASFNLFSGAMEGDLDRMFMALVELDVTGAGTNMEKLKEDMVYELNKFYDVGLEKVDIKEVFNSLVRIARKNHVRMPANLVLLGKCVITSQGMARKLDPDFNVVAEGKPFLKKLAVSKLAPKRIAHHLGKTFNEFREFMVRLPRQTNELILKAKDAEFVVHTIEQDMRHLAREVDRSSNRITLGLMITALLISGALIHGMPQPSILTIPILTLLAFLVAIGLVGMLIISVLMEQR
ncbi:MAG: AarF/ABC1/UbiB kinase family protein [archaeon]